MAHNQEPLSKTPIIQFNGQDFNYLWDRCLSRGLLFEDETFPAEISSIGLELLKGKDLSGLKWKRPKDLLMGKSEPHFILEGASRFDIEQGCAGDCWFLAALGSLTQNEKHLQKILRNQSFSHQYAGIFRFWFWQCGQWVEVVVDDRLPVLNNEYLFVHPRSNNQEFWPCLLEKAYAKFRGSYLHLHYGYLPDALVDLTGGVVTTMDLHSSPSDLVMMVKTAAKEESLMTCATPVGPTGMATSMENGLVSQHAYTVTGAETIQSRTGWEELIRLWNPWGGTEWRGRWRDGSPEWQEARDPRRSQLYKNKEDGEFWMPCRDFQENFSCLYVCSQSPVSLDHGGMTFGTWSEMTFKSRVIPGSTTDSYDIGGLQSDTQYIFSVPEITEGNNVAVSFNIIPQTSKANDGKFPLNFHVFKVDSQFQHFRERLPPTFFSQFRKADKGTVTRSKYNLTKCFTLSPGTYVVVVSAYKEAAEFLLRIFLKMPNTNRNPGSNFNLKALKASLPENGSQQSIFYKYAQQGLNIDATRLQSLLNQELLQGLPGDTFSLDEARSIVALMDLKVNGQLDQEEFSRLWSRLLRCQRVYLNTQGNSGIFLSSDLWKAIRNTDFLAGISVSSELLDLMALRYSDSSGRVSFPSLVCFLIRLEAMAKAFQNLSKDGQGLYLTKTEWMNLVMYN
ncbi:calpain-13 [Desmodus rotundus]|uniref:calpain-13 n=1 Tax=Desmodus rotundus TaxID=9430 RepID=UPI0023815542|nr:calpain-13 [Desmodus rotundus]XP_045045236.2 calpain-13 [Desmodus rotundus]XP_045045237.2 calpain-13 [Desmodus rotundus]